MYDFSAVCVDPSLDDDSKMSEMGRLMYESHASCRDQYECSHPQLDKLVELSRQLGALGAR